MRSSDVYAISSDSHIVRFSTHVVTPLTLGSDDLVELLVSHKSTSSSLETTTSAAIAAAFGEPTPNSMGSALSSEWQLNSSPSVLQLFELPIPTRPNTNAGNEEEDEDLSDDEDESKGVNSLVTQVANAFRNRSFGSGKQRVSSMDAAKSARSLLSVMRDIATRSDSRPPIRQSQISVIRSVLGQQIIYPDDTIFEADDYKSQLPAAPTHYGAVYPTATANPAPTILLDDCEPVNYLAGIHVTIAATLTATTTATSTITAVAVSTTTYSEMTTTTVGVPVTATATTTTTAIATSMVTTTAVSTTMSTIGPTTTTTTVTSTVTTTQTAGPPITITISAPNSSPPVSQPASPLASTPESTPALTPTSTPVSTPVSTPTSTSASTPTSMSSVPSSTPPVATRMADMDVLPEFLAQLKQGRFSVRGQNASELAKEILRELKD
ncbi:hypothetical protein GGI07_004127 [Coemansia sp. Benny D115]|nr:hypothetical protein GGI07_004127 [Coemansia sp. Benny D115]